MGSQVRTVRATPLAYALFYAQRDVAEVLARGTITPDNLRAAAGLGRLDRLRACYRSILDSAPVAE